MAVIRIDIDGLTKNRQEIEQKIQELRRNNQRLDSLIRQIESSWDGKASEAYVQKMREYQQKAVAMEAVFEEFRLYIDQTISRFEQQDKSAAAKIRAC